MSPIAVTTSETRRRVSSLSGSMASQTTAQTMKNATVSGKTRNACESTGGDTPTTSTTNAARAEDA